MKTRTTIHSTSRDTIERDKTRLFYALCSAVAVLLLLVGLTVGLLLSGTSESWVTFSQWLTSSIINIGAGIVTVSIFAWLIRAFHVTETEPSAEIQRFRVAGISAVLVDWLREKPTNEQLHEMFTQARTVELLGVTLHNSLIGLEWFPDALAERIKDPGKVTRLMLLNPDSAETRRREAEGSGRKLYTRACSAKEQVSRALGSLNHDATSANVRYYDFAPTANILRFDDRMFVVLLMYAKGGLSPALELAAPGLLFDQYSSAFNTMWNDLGTQHHSGPDVRQ